MQVIDTKANRQMLTTALKGEEPASLAINGAEVARIEPEELGQLMAFLGKMARGATEEEEEAPTEVGALTQAPTKASGALASRY